MKIAQQMASACLLLAVIACDNRATIPADGAVLSDGVQDDAAFYLDIVPNRDQDTGSPGETFDCGNGNVVDLTAYPSCVALVKKLYPCCAIADIVTQEYFAFMLKMCDPALRFSDADCKALDFPGWIYAECETLKMTYGCQSGDAWEGCGGMSGGSLADGCEVEWSCGSNKYKVECSGVPGNYLCKCIENGTETGTFQAPDMCSTVVAPDRNRQAYRANNGCGWKLPLHP